MKNRAPVLACFLLFSATLVGCNDPAPPPAAENARVPSSDAPASANTSITSATSFTAAEHAAADTIAGERMRALIAEIADDRYEGRAPGSAGDTLAREYLISQLMQMGLQPGGDDGTWEQSFDLVGITSQQPAIWSFSSAQGELPLAQNTDYIAASGVQLPTSMIENAEVVFVGYGIEAPEYQWDDFKDMDLTGKVLLMLNNDPDWDPALFAGITRLYYGRWDYKFASAARQGAVGAIIMHTDPSAAYPWQVVQTSFSGEQFELPAADELRTQVNAWITEDAARRLVAQGGLELDALLEQAKQRDFRPVPLGSTTSLTLTNTLTQKTTANVIAVLPGSDPALADEAVIYTAHHDHLGMKAPTGTADEDLIYNGALDNASGVAQIMEVAGAFTDLDAAPRRSIVINFVGAEEQGLLGSEFYAAHPTFAPGKIAANINLDGGSIWGRTRDLTYIGYGKSSLDSVVEGVAALYERSVTADQFPDRGLFYRSDQFNFARIGVPAVYLDGGTDVIGQPPGWGEEQINHYTDVNYHQPSDELDDTWNFDGMVEDAKISFLIGLDIANADTLPGWNAGDEFEAARIEALRAPE